MPYEELPHEGYAGARRFIAFVEAPLPAALLPRFAGGRGAVRALAPSSVQGIGGRKNPIQ
jgi:hypothetical protein